MKLEAKKEGKQIQRVKKMWTLSALLIFFFPSLFLIPAHSWRPVATLQRFPYCFIIIFFSLQKVKLINLTVSKVSLFIHTLAQYKTSSFLPPTHHFYPHQFYHWSYQLQHSSFLVHQNYFSIVGLPSLF